MRRIPYSQSPVARTVLHASGEIAGFLDSQSLSEMSNGADSFINLAKSPTLGTFLIHISISIT
jgi:hypothetical protein